MNINYYGILLPLLYIAGIFADSVHRFDQKEFVRSYLISVFNPCNEADGYQSWEYVKTHDHDSYIEMTVLENKILRALHAQQVSTVQTTQEVIQEQIKEYIQKRCYDVVRTKLKNDNHLCVSGIVSKVMAEFRHAYNSSDELKTGIYRPFIGKKFTQLIESYAVHCDHLTRDYHNAAQSYKYLDDIYLKVGKNRKEAFDDCVKVQRDLHNLYNVNATLN